MVLERDDEKRMRRRMRNGAFFSYEDGSSELSVDDTLKDKPMARPKSSITYVLLFARAVFSLLGVVLTTFIILGVTLRTTGFFCKYTSLKSSFCKYHSIRHQEPIFATLPHDATPATKILNELGKLNDMAISVEFTGFAMNLFTRNFSSVYKQFQKNPEVFQIPEADLNELASTAGSSQSVIEVFTKNDYFFRHNELLWGLDGQGLDAIKGLQDKIDLFHHNLNTSNSLALAISEQILHRLPYATSFTLIRNFATEYYAFVGQQYDKTEKLVKTTSEANLSLGDLFSALSKLEKRLEDVVSERERFCVSEHAANDSKLCKMDPSHQLREVQMMRAAVQWCRDAIKVAETHYKNIYNEIRIAADALDAEMSSYENLLPSKGSLSLHRFKQVLHVERQQIGAYLEQLGKAEDVVEEIKTKLDRDQDATVHKFEAAMQNRVLNWW